MTSLVTCCLETQQTNRRDNVLLHLHWELPCQTNKQTNKRVSSGWWFVRTTTSEVLIYPDVSPLQAVDEILMSVNPLNHLQSCRRTTWQLFLTWTKFAVMALLTTDQINALTNECPGGQISWSVSCVLDYSSKMFRGGKVGRGPALILLEYLRRLHWAD